MYLLSIFNKLSCEIEAHSAQTMHTCRRSARKRCITMGNVPLRILAVCNLLRVENADFSKKDSFKFQTFLLYEHVFNPFLDQLKNPNTYSDRAKIALSNDIEFIIILTPMKKMSCVILLRMLAKALKFDFVIKPSFRIHALRDIVGFVPKFFSTTWHIQMSAPTQYSDIICISLIVIYLFQSFSSRSRTIVCNILKL